MCVCVMLFHLLILFMEVIMSFLSVGTRQHPQRLSGGLGVEVFSVVL